MTIEKAIEVCMISGYEVLIWSERVPKANPHVRNYTVQVSKFKIPGHEYEHVKRKFTDYALAGCEIELARHDLRAICLMKPAPAL